MIPAFALYRRSRSHQDLSIEEQRQAVLSYAAEHGFQIVREFADSKSGLDTERRHGFQELLRICSQPDRRGADVVLCYDVSQKLSQVVQRGLRAHAERGSWTGGRPPYGYRRAVREPDGALRILE